MKKFPPFPNIYVISPMQENTRTLLEQIRAALKCGVRLVQYRDKNLDMAKRSEQALALRQLCSQYNALLLINDDVQLAKTCQADGVHLGQGDMPIQQAREQLGEQAIIGITCHDSLELAQKAADLGADYLSFGCFFPSQTKPNAKPADLAILKQAREQFALPIAAIGGISHQTAPLLIQSGVDLLAISGGIFSSSDISYELCKLLAICSAN